jgi:hypothetical protein
MQEPKVIMKRVNKQGFTYMQDIYDAMKVKEGEWVRYTITGTKLAGEKA